MNAPQSEITALSEASHVLEEVQAKPSRFKPYPKCRASEVDWVESVPEHWTQKRLRFLAQINPVKSQVANLPPDTKVSFVPMEAVQEYGGLELDNTRFLGDVYQGYTYFQNGDVVIAKITPCFENGKGSIAVKGRANCTTCGRVKVYHLSEGVGQLVGSWIPIPGIIKEPASGQRTQDGNRKFNIDTT